MKDQFKGAFGNKESGARNKLVEIYRQLWGEYAKYIKNINQSRQHQRGLGGTSSDITMTPKTILDFLVIYKFDQRL